ncbi:MAG TPA: diacylglycerol kinase family protein [Myxococcales bacterium]|nr:diacylglycerol kinase family protein [Myxococcales bacterium]
MPGLAIIANPNAHRIRNWPLASEALRKAAPGAAMYETRTERELREAAAQVGRDRPRVVAIAGGDGTVTHTVTALAEAMQDQLPALALLGGGAYDSLAPLGGRGAAEDRLRKLSEAVATGAPLATTERDTLRVSLPSKAPGRCGFRFGVGLPVRFIEEIYASGKAGFWTSSRVLVRGVASSFVRGKLARRLFEPIDLRVAVDGEEWPRIPIYGVVGSTVAEAGLGLRPFRRATEQPGSFQVLGLTAGPRSFAVEVPRLLFGRPARRDRLLEAVAEEVELQASRPFGFFLDGEIDTAPGRLVVGVGPRVALVHA